MQNFGKLQEESSAEDFVTYQYCLARSPESACRCDSLVMRWSRKDPVHSSSFLDLQELQSNVICFACFMRSVSGRRICSPLSMLLWCPSNRCTIVTLAWKLSPYPV